MDSQEIAETISNMTIEKAVEFMKQGVYKFNIPADKFVAKERLTQEPKKSGAKTAAK